MSKQFRFLPPEVIAYLGVTACWFVSFGLQFVLIPFIVLQNMALDSRALGISQTALTIPFLLLLLASGLLAEKYDKKIILVRLYMLGAIPAIILAFLIARNYASLPILICYGLTLGSIGAFILPARDAILNEVADRAHRKNKRVTIQSLSIWSALVQFAATIFGLAMGRTAAQLGPDILLFIQGLSLFLGGTCALFLKRSRTVIIQRKLADETTTLLARLKKLMIEQGKSVQSVYRNQTALIMVVSMVGVGIFIVGASFLVLLPAFLNGKPEAMSNVFLAYWSGAFVATAGLTAMASVKGSIRRSGRALISSQILGVVCMVIMVKPIDGPALVSLSFVWGLASGISIAMSRAIIQEAAQAEKLSRILAVYQLGFMGGAPVGALCAGYLAKWIGPNLAVLFPIIGMTVFFVWVLMFTNLWKLTTDQIRENSAKEKESAS